MSEKLKMERGSGNIFLDVGFNKVEAEDLEAESSESWQKPGWGSANGRTPSGIPT